MDDLIERVMRGEMFKSDDKGIPSLTRSLVGYDKDVTLNDLRNQGFLFIMAGVEIGCLFGLTPLGRQRLISAN